MKPWKVFKFGSIIAECRHYSEAFEIWKAESADRIRYINERDFWTDILVRGEDI